MKNTQTRNAASETRQALSTPNSFFFANSRASFATSHASAPHVGASASERARPRPSGLSKGRPQNQCGLRAPGTHNGIQRGPATRTFSRVARPCPARSTNLNRARSCRQNAESERRRRTSWCAVAPNNSSPTKLLKLSLNDNPDDALRAPRVRKPTQDLRQKRRVALDRVHRSGP